MQTSISFLNSAYPFDKTIERINVSCANYIHVDVMDGLYVNHVTSFTKEMFEELKKSPKPKEIHLMTLHLKKYIDLFSCIQPEYMIYEFEATAKQNEIIKYIKSKNLKVGIAIAPLTNLDCLLPYLKKIDLVLVMSVIPGAGGQKFLKETVDRIEKLKKIKEEKKLHFEISVDGGINDKTIELLHNKGLNRVVAGSYVCKNADFDTKIKSLQI